MARGARRARACGARAAGEGGTGPPPGHAPARRAVRRRRARTAGALLVAALLAAAAACGSRLPEADFPRPTSSGAPAEGEPIRVGVIASSTSPVGGGAFDAPGEGARAYFAALNARGGIHGRPVEVVGCDDGGSGPGNTACVHRLVDEDKVVALVATTAFDYAGAARVARAGVPDIGGQPLGPAYDTYPHLYGIYGSAAPRTGGSPGWDGTLYGGTEVYRWFREEQGARTAAVVSYNQAASAAYARLMARGLEKEGYTVVREQLDFALPNFRAAAADIARSGADLVFDALDTHGNVRLCQALDAAGAEFTAKVTNVQNWNDAVADDYAEAPRCRNALWATGSSRNHDEAAHPAVAEFREGMRRHGASAGPLSQWQLEGWAAARWFADAAASCGRDPSRACVDRAVRESAPYTAGGLLLPVSFERLAEPPATRRTCLSVARWQDGRGWVDQGRDMTRDCFTVPQLPYRP
ncbi:ABC transporter substrate-binding protein [Streptomyces sp. C10-9-1]|uniref:ABC transporter substrate-binding protein n=1 Tax=Streptomyces sp. C10-9-1 TaxID=1859285 RepID=UPI003D729BAA